MPVGREQFDADLASHIEGDNNYIAAVDAFLALGPITDLAAEDATVAAGLAAINAARDRVPPPPGP